MGSDKVDRDDLENLSDRELVFRWHDALTANETLDAIGNEITKRGLGVTSSPYTKDVFNSVVLLSNLLISSLSAISSLAAGDNASALQIVKDTQRELAQMKIVLPALFGIRESSDD